MEAASPVSPTPTLPGRTVAQQTEPLDCGCVICTRTDESGRRWRFRSQRCMRRDLPDEHRYGEQRGPRLLEDDEK